MNFLTKIKEKAYKVLPPQYWYPVVAVVLGAILSAVILWQVEIVAWNEDEFFEFPFYLFIVQKWIARDFWYMMLIPADILIVWGAFQLGARNVITHINIVTYKIIKKFRMIDGKPINEWMELEKND